MKTTSHLFPTNKFLAHALPLVLALTLTSCMGNPNNQPENIKKTIPVHGEVFVDDQPGTGIRVALTPLGGIDPKNPTVTRGQTGEGSTFELGTYSNDDGAPAGKYKLTFFQRDIKEKFDLRRKPKDQLGGNYMEPKDSKFTVTIRPLEGEEKFLDIGRFDLTTKGVEAPKAEPALGDRNAR